MLCHAVLCCVVPCCAVLCRAGLARAVGRTRPAMLGCGSQARGPMPAVACARAPVRVLRAAAAAPARLHVAPPARPTLRLAVRRPLPPPLPQHWHHVTGAPCDEYHLLMHFHAKQLLYLAGHCMEDSQVGAQHCCRPPGGTAAAGRLPVGLPGRLLPASAPAPALAEPGLHAVLVAPGSTCPHAGPPLPNPRQGWPVTPRHTAHAPLLPAGGTEVVWRARRAAVHPSPGEHAPR